MYGGPIGTHQSSFEWDHPRPPRPPLPRDWGFAIYLPRFLSKNFGENGAWAYPGNAQTFGIPPIISGTDKATDFKFGGYIYRANPNKSPLKFCRKGSVDKSRDCPNFLGTPYYLRNG